MFQLQYYMLVILPNVWYRCIYILGEIKTHTHVHADTHNILSIYACTSPELNTYKYGDISSKAVVILPYFVHMHISFQAKEVDAPKGEEQVFFMTQQGQLQWSMKPDSSWEALQYLETAEK